MPITHLPGGNQVFKLQFRAAIFYIHMKHMKDHYEKLRDYEKKYFNLEGKSDLKASLFFCEYLFII